MQRLNGIVVSCRKINRPVSSTYIQLAKAYAIKQRTQEHRNPHTGTEKTLPFYLRRTDMASQFCAEWLSGQERLVRSYRPFMLAVCVSNVVFSVVAVTGNLLVIPSLWKASSIPSNVKRFFLSLAFSDLSVGLIAQQMFAIIIVVMLRATADATNDVQFLCPASLTVSYFISFFLVCVSFLNICAIGVDRLLAVSLHLRYGELVTSKRVMIAVVALWLTSAAAALIFISFPKYSREVIVITEIAGIFLITVAYFRIFKVITHHQIQILSQQREVQSNEMMTELLRQKKSAINAVFVYLLFLTCFLPHLGSEILLIVKHFRLSFLVAEDVALSVVFLNSSLNPLVYCWRYREVREIAMGILKKIVISHQ